MQLGRTRMKERRFQKRWLYNETIRNCTQQENTPKRTTPPYHGPKVGVKLYDMMTQPCDII